MLTYEVGQKMLRNTLQALRWISDQDYQKRVWIQGEGANDFDETICYFFDNCDVVLKYSKLCGITENQYNTLEIIKHSLEEFSTHHHYEPEFIDTPEWDEITKMAKEVLQAFHYESDKSEDVTQS